MPHMVAIAANSNGPCPHSRGCQWPSHGVAGNHSGKTHQVPSGGGVRTSSSRQHQIQSSQGGKVQEALSGTVIWSWGIRKLFLMMRYLRIDHRISRGSSRWQGEDEKHSRQWIVTASTCNFHTNSFSQIDIEWNHNQVHIVRKKIDGGNPLILTAECARQEVPSTHNEKHLEPKPVPATSSPSALSHQPSEAHPWSSLGSQPSVIGKEKLLCLPWVFLPLDWQSHCLPVFQMLALGVHCSKHICGFTWDHVGFLF